MEPSWLHHSPVVCIPRLLLSNSSILPLHLLPVLPSITCTRAIIIAHEIQSTLVTNNSGYNLNMVPGEFQPALCYHRFWYFYSIAIIGPHNNVQLHTMLHVTQKSFNWYSIIDGKKWFPFWLQYYDASILHILLFKYLCKGIFL